MTLYENLYIPPGCTLVCCGLNDNTKRDLNYPRSWKGLALDELDLLQTWINDIKHHNPELHTDVPVGVVPTTPLNSNDTLITKQANALYPLRIDACVQLNTFWYVIEVKRRAGYIALGQILTYHYFAKRTCPQLTNALPMILTDQPQDALAPVFAHYGIHVVSTSPPSTETTNLPPPPNEPPT